MLLAPLRRHGRSSIDRASTAWLRRRRRDRLRSIDVATLPYPGIATDYKPLIITMLSVADGVGIVTENLYPGRFRYVEELQRLGADIRTDGHHAVVRGVPRLSGAPVRAPDIRAGAALVVAGLAADGETVDHAACTTSTAATTTSSGRLHGVGASIERRPLHELTCPVGANPPRSSRPGRARPDKTQPALYGVGALFAGAHPEQLLTSIAPDLAVTDLAGLGRVGDDLDDPVGDVGRRRCTSSFTLGMKSTVYSEPRKVSVLPR